MKHWKKGLLIPILLCVGFAAGIFLLNEPVSREIQVSYQNGERPGEYIINKVIKNTEDQSAIDNIMMIYIHKEKMMMNEKRISDPVFDFENPDVFIRINSPKQYTVLIDSRVWFLEGAAIIADRAGEDWEDVDFYSIDPEDAKYLKKIIEYNEKNSRK
ncbi:hypothetical protein [Bacillus sp. AK031]